VSSRNGLLRAIVALVGAILGLFRGNSGTLLSVRLGNLYMLVCGKMWLGALRLF